MSNDWQSFVASQPMATGIAEPLPECAVFDLSHLTLTRITGEDSIDFLQGQFTNDIAQVSSRHSQLSSYCTPKGRMLASFRIFRQGDALYLQMPESTQAPLLKRLPMFVLMSKVNVADAGSERISVGFAGECSSRLLSEFFAELPASANEAVEQADLVLIRIPGETPRFQLIGPPSSVIGLWQACGERVTPATADHWELLEIRAGIPMIQAGTVEAFVPQMINLQLIDGVSFTKGCYTGQEVVARMKYLGKLKRQMFLARIDASEPPAPGTDLRSESSASGQGAGKVVNAQRTPDGCVEMLVVAEISSREADDLYLADDSAGKLEFMQLPYSLTED